MAGWVCGWVGWLEEWGLKLTSAKVEVEVEAELGNSKIRTNMELICPSNKYYQGSIPNEFMADC